MASLRLAGGRKAGCVHSDRLTRQELTWLLTQEARSAAEKLRKGVVNLAAPEIRAGTLPAPAGLESELDVLDDAMKMLASLHTGAATRGRRGRIDLAALVCEVAPNARVSIEPGSGTEVFGDESELRRMLQVFVGSSAPTGGATELGAPEVSIRREGSEIRVSVTLGPDSSANVGTERAWLNRMAVRYGGRVELEGGTESIVLPADGAAETREVESLRRELEAAQRQGEAYARELAAVFTYSQSQAIPHFSSVPPESSVSLGALTGLSAALSPQIRGVMSVLAQSQAGERAAEALAEGVELAADLARLARCPIHEARQPVNLVDVARTAVRELSPRAARSGVTLDLDVPEKHLVHTRPGPAALLVHLLVADAIAATPAGASVLVSVEASTLVVEDGGPAIVAETWPQLLAGQIEPGAAGRPNTFACYCIGVLAPHLDVDVLPAEAPRARLVARFGLP
jgi:two-component system, OmpR family, sensor kinase